MQIRIKNYNEEILTITASDAKEIISYQNIMASPHIKKPYEGLLYYKGKLLPVLGPLPSVWENSENYDNLPWILISGNEARVIQGLPEILALETAIARIA